ncbi:Zn-ribbon domain-containing OB-fold protein [Nocardia pseudovaccinii]|uniref:Zn-ribbon domain-containing OB-fold protein n=1 Tax=Nocardia pseudovaccinii TaxID=189540 RepID=UPI0007A4E383|nr:OB-fold domain-containing protein [Nocardia pseudovaccinii]
MRARVPALGAEGWFTEDGPALIGSRCTTCGTVAFPAASYRCGNPGCDGHEFAQERLGSAGTVWSYTDLRYQPPSPYVTAGEPYRPCALLAVEVDDSGLVILGQAVADVSVDDLRVGTRVRLVIDTLFSDDDHDYTIWKWRPMEVAG